MTLKERWNACETKAGTIIKNYVGYGMGVCTVLGGANEYIQVVPAEWVPVWIKTAVVAAGVAGYVGGKMTVKKKPEPDVTN